MHQSGALLIPPLSQLHERTFSRRRRLSAERADSRLMRTQTVPRSGGIRVFTEAEVLTHNVQ